MTIHNGLGIQSFCFRDFKDNGVVAEKLKSCGVTTIELCGVHVDFADADSFADVIRAYQSAGVSIASIGVNGMKGDEEAERLYFEFIKAADAEFMSVSFDVSSVPESYRVAERLAEEYDVRLGIHNHGGRHWLGSAQMLKQVFATTNERIGFCIDTAWALDSREDPVKMAESFGDRLYGVHFKDFVFQPNGDPEDVIVGTGNLDLAGLVGVMEKADFDGYGFIEYEGDVENPVPALTECVQKIRETSIAA